jgi:hypothetical protein
MNMVQEEKEEKRVVAKEKPLGGTKVVEQTEVQQVKEQPSTTAQPGRAENVAGKSGEVVGKGLKKVASVVGEFTSGLSKEMKSHEHHKQGGVQEARPAEYRSEQREQTGEAPRTEVTKKETIEKKVTEENK